MNLLFVTGHGKTATSTVVGILNSHPEIFVLFEVYAQRNDPPTPRGQQFLEEFPGARPCFGAGASWADPYSKMGAWLSEEGYNYRCFGDKVLCHHLTDGALDHLAPHDVIYLVRDLRTWLCKNIVVADYGALGGVTKKAVTYVDDFLRSMLFPRVLHVRMEDLIHRNDEVIAALSSFLKIDLAEAAAKWWKTIGAYREGDPKAAINWWAGHDSSRLRPTREDTKAVLANHVFWDRILPIFDKYYLALGQVREKAEIEEDRRKLAEIAPALLSLEELYQSVESVSFGSGLFGALGHRSSNPHTKRFSLKRE